MDAEHIAGVTVAVVQNGEIALLKGYGSAGRGRRMDAVRTLVRIGSVSKTFTWIGLMKEVERGRIELDHPINDYLPAPLQIPAQGFLRPIRVLDLMSHAAGFEDLAQGHLFVYTGEQVMSQSDYLARHRPDRVREPGELASYSNYGASLAGYLVANANGQDFETVMQNEVFTPLGMTSTTFREPYAARRGLPEPMPAAQADRLSSGFMWTGTEFREKHFEYISQVAPAGSVSTTAADMARYLLMLLNNGKLGQTQIFGPETAKAFRTPILNVPEGVNGWAHGFMARPLPGGFKSFGHGGATRIFFTNLVVVPDLALGVFANSNTTTGRALVERLPKLIVERFYASPAPQRPGKAALLQIADRYTGPYIPTRRAYSGLEKFVNLFGAEDGVSVTSSGYLVTRTGSLVQSWVPDGAPGEFRAADGDQRLSFKLDAHGRAASFPITRGSYTLERAGLVMNPELFTNLAALSLLVALATCISTAFRVSRGTSPTRWQARANGLLSGVAALWLVAFAAFGLAGNANSDSYADWPGPFLLTASTAALLAALGSAALVVTMPAMWRRAPDSPVGWAVWRKSWHMAAAAVFVLFAILVGLRGGLIPWA